MRGFDNQHRSPFVLINNARVRTHIAVNPLPSGDISRAVFIGMIRLEMQ